MYCTDVKLGLCSWLGSEASEHHARLRSWAGNTLNLSCYKRKGIFLWSVVSNSDPYSASNAGRAESFIVIYRRLRGFKFRTSGRYQNTVSVSSTCGEGSLQEDFCVVRNWERFGAAPFSELLETQKSGWMSLKQEDKETEPNFQGFFFTAFLSLQEVSTSNKPQGWVVAAG